MISSWCSVIRLSDGVGNRKFILLSCFVGLRLMSCMFGISLVCMMLLMSCVIIVGRCVVSVGLVLIGWLCSVLSVVLCYDLGFVNWLSLNRWCRYLLVVVLCGNMRMLLFGGLVVIVLDNISLLFGVIVVSVL